MVISIIALLVGILLPALSMARATAQNAQCMANLRSIGQAVAVYAVDFRDVFPGRLDDNLSNSGNLVGRKGLDPHPANLEAEDRLLYHYFGDTDAAACPRDVGTQYSKGHSVYEWLGSSYFHPDRFSDAWTSNRTHAEGGIWSMEGLPIDLARQPTRKVIFSENYLIPNRDENNPLHHWHGEARPPEANAVFLDAHVSRITRKTQSDPDNGSAVFLDLPDGPHEAYADDAYE